MIPALKKNTVEAKDITKLIETHTSSLMKAFYESQSSFLCGIYKRYKSLETANIILCFAKNVHLEIIRQREKDLNFNVSLENFWKNYHKITKPAHKITAVVKTTGIPKETVRRKMKILIENNFLIKDRNNKSYYWNISIKDKEDFYKINNQEINDFGLFVSKIMNDLGLKLDSKLIIDEINSQFSFYWYHYLSCQLEWLKWWQLKLKDNDLLLISLQATIPTLQFINKKENKINLENVYEHIGKIDTSKCNSCSVSATSVSDITGIPRATCIRKLDKLVYLGFLIRETKTKRYSINQTYNERTKNIHNKENIAFTISTFSEYISIIINSLIHNNKL